LAAQIEKVYIERGQQVRTGDTLFTLKSPELDHQLQLSEQRLENLRSQLSLQLSNAEMRDQRLVLEQQLAELIAKRHGFREQQQRLHITAPFSGEVVSIAEALTPHRWLPTSLPLATLIKKEQLEVSAYLREDALSQITHGSKARFYPDNPDEPPKSLTVAEIDPASITTLDEPYLASIHEGPIAVHQQQQQLIPNESYYKVRLQLQESTPLLQQVTRGTVQIEAEPRSLLQQAWLTVSAVMIRESGF